MVVQKEYIFEKGIEFPTTSAKSTKMSRTLSIMEVGDSFFIDCDKDMVTVRSTLYYYNKKTGKKFSTRKDPNRLGIRIFRLA